MIFTGSDLVFNGYNFQSDLCVEEIRTAFTAGSWFPQQVIPGRAGVVLAPRRETRARTIEVDVRLIEERRSDVTDKVTEIAGRLLTDAPAKLVTRRDVGRWWMAVFQGEPELEQLYDTGFATLEFLAPDGYMFSDQITLAKPAGSSAVTIEGTRRAAPIFTLTLDAAVNAVSVVAGGKTVKIQRAIGTWPAGTVVEFNTSAGTVRIGAALANEFLTLGSRWPELEPGGHTVVFTGGAGTIKYNPRWA